MTLRVRCLGGCEITGPAGPLHLESAKTRALLVYLAVNARPHQRHQLMGLLWANLPEANARRALRHALWNLRRALRRAWPALLQTDGQSVWLAPGARLQCDVAVFEAGCASDDPSRWTEAAGLYAGDFLDACYVDEAPAFQEWTLAERARLRGLAAGTLARLTSAAAGGGDEEAALAHAQRLLRLDPTHEAAQRRVMGLLAERGRCTEALALYEALRAALRAELDTAPSAETQRLARRLRRGRA